MADMTEEEQLRVERAALDQEWARLRQERSEFEEERISSGVEYKLFVGNLDPTSTEEQLRALFEPFGAIKEVIILKDREGVSKRSGFIKYFIKANAEAAVDGLNGKIKDRDSPQHIVVRFANPKPTQGVGAVAQMAAPGAGAYAQHQYQQYQQNPYGMGAGAFGGMAQGSMGQMGSTGSAGGGTFGRGPAGANLYINNLSRQATELDVQTMFADFGNVVSVKVFPNQGYGFVSFDNVASAQAAIATLNGLAMADGHKRLEVSQKKEKGSPGSSRFSPY
jgi:RNA recognition motif-containing protein